MLEEDHIKAKAVGGSNKWENYQLMHRHCHDEKTRLDMVQIRIQKGQGSSSDKQ